MSLLDTLKIHKNTKDENGKVYGRLTVLKMVDERLAGAVSYLCRCLCGNEKIVRGSHLRKGTTRSCGCLAAEVQREIGRKNQKYGTDKIRRHPVGISKGRKVFLSNFMSKYKLFPEVWDELIIKSEGRCGICENQFNDNQQGVNVDHDHKTGRVRGLLCQRCNALLAGLEDKGFCIKATLYLQKGGD
jgi:hypothetical protein